MKKLLALVLALVMTLSLATVSTNAAFADDADISYDEAAGVLSAVGVFVGDGKNFNPKAALNREQAAKLVAYMALGEEVAEALPAVAMFDDVAASSWAAKYIAYCADAGIITGDGAGKFFPAAPVDGYAFSKMLLCALGYEAEAEGYVGANWQINVAKDAKSLDLAKGGVDLSKALTREQAAQVMFNAIKCAPVKEYANVGSSVTIGNVEVQTSWGEASLETELYYELTWDSLVYTANQYDAFNRNANEWYYGDEDWTGTYADDTADFVVSKNLTQKEIAAMLKGYKLGEYKVNDDTDVSATVTLTKGAVPYSYTFSGDTIVDGLDQLFEDGKVVEIYAGTDKVINQIVEIDYAVDVVEDIDVDKKTGDVTYKFENAGSYENTEDTTAVVFAAEVAEDDVVTTFAGADGKLYVYPTTKMVGEVVAVDSDGVATMGGKTYKASAAGSWVFSVSDEANYYLDQYGFVVDSTAISAASKNFAYVLDVNASLTQGFGTGVPAGQVQVILEDGTVGVYDLKVAKKSGNYYVMDSDASTATFNYVLATDTRANVQADLEWLLKDQTFAYVINGSTITFKAPAAEAGKTSVADMYATQAETYIAKNDTAIRVDYGTVVDAVLNNATTFIFWDDSDEEVEKVIVGNTNLGDYEFEAFANTDVVISYNEAGSKATAKYVFVMGGFAADAGDVDTYGYVDADSYVVSKDSDDNLIKTYTMTLADGSTLSLVCEDDSISSTSGIYSYKSDKTFDSTNCLNADGYVVGRYAASVDGSIVTINGQAYNLTADTKVVNVSTIYDEVDDAMVYAYVTKVSNAPSNVLETIFIVD